jgi:hypothetical protein
LNVRAVLVAVFFDHTQVLVTANSFDRWQIDTGLHQMRDDCTGELF